jgi:prepilin-type N-terminal cleavage/methylation domain-containing protein
MRRTFRSRPQFVRSDRGFTMLELLACLVVVGILMAILLPAVQSARESARRVECQQKLRQLGLGIHHFEEVSTEYPRWRGPARRSSPSSDFWDYDGYSPHVQILPYLEQQSVAEMRDLQRGDGPSWNPRVRSEPWNIRLPLFFCPSDNGAFGTNYRGCTGNDAREDHRGRDGGVFGRVRSTRPRDVTDGTSQTVMMSEKLISSLDSAFDQERDYWYTGLSAVLPDGGRDVDADQMRIYCRFLTSSPDSYFPYAGLEWVPATYNDTLYNHVAPPNAKEPDCSIEPSSPNATHTGNSFGNAFQSSGSFRATSAHPGGVSALLADGAVRFVGNSIDIGIWRALASIAGEEIIEF